VDAIFKAVDRYPGLEATVDLDEQRVVLHLSEAEEAFHFDIDPGVKEHLQRGLDEIGLTLRHVSDIDAFEKAHDVQMTQV